jgi:GT2 family glycosyltransferase
MAPTVSVVIPTHDRPKQLFALLSSLRDARMSEIEKILVVDDSRIHRPLYADFPELPLEIVSLPQRVFISRAKNIGWRRSVSDYVYFIDDDNVVTKDTIRLPLETIEARGEIGAIVPAVLYFRRPEIVWVYSTPWAPGRWGHSLTGRNLPRNPSLEGRLSDTDAMPNAALVRRRALEDIGGFNEALIVNSSADAALRLKNAGWEVYAHTGSFIYHDVEPPGRVGYWAQHGIADPTRVYYELRDWFSFMHSLHRDEGFFRIRATLHASGFMLPNALSYVLVGGSRGRQLLKEMLRGYVSSLKIPSRG